MSSFVDKAPKIVVLDDDPTGIQMVHDVAVYTSWEEEACENLLQQSEAMVYILTNTRALKPEAARCLLRELTQNLITASRRSNIPFWLVTALGFNPAGALSAGIRNGSRRTQRAWN